MDSQIQEIKDRINIADIVGQYVKLERAGRNFRARCPFHKEKTPSFFVSPERGTYICFGCGEKGDVFSFLQKVEGSEFSEVLKELAQKAGVVLKRQVSPETKNAVQRLIEVCEAAALFFESVLTARTDVQTYLANRGVTTDTNTRWRLGYAPAAWETLSNHLTTKGFSREEIVHAGLAISSEKKQSEIYDRFRGRIMFPIQNANGGVIGFSGRFFEKVPGTEETDPAKYVNSPETPIFKKSFLLYGLHHAKQAIRKHDCILLVEGQFDLIMCHQSGLPFTVALSGTALTEEHLQLLGRLSKRLVLALDGDAAGLRAGLKSAHMALRAGFDVKIPTFARGKDPADIAKEDPQLLKAAIRESKPAIEFFLTTFRSEEHDERKYKKRVETQILPLVAAIDSKIDQAHFISLIAQCLSVPESAVSAEVTKIGSHPALVPEIPSETVVPQEAPSAVERSATMLLFSYPADAPEVAQLRDILGKDRMEALQETYAPDAELFRFSLEVLGEDKENTVRSLLQTIERATIEERIQLLQRTLREEDPPEDTLKKIAELKHRQEELRK